MQAIGDIAYACGVSAVVKPTTVCEQGLACGDWELRSDERNQSRRIPTLSPIVCNDACHADLNRLRSACSIPRVFLRFGMRANDARSN